jgi:hypothetical protein
VRMVPVNYLRNRFLSRCGKVFQEKKDLKVLPARGSNSPGYFPVVSAQPSPQTPQYKGHSYRVRRGREAAKEKGCALDRFVVSWAPHR